MLKCSYTMDYLYHYKSPFGPLTLASDGTSLIGLWFDGQKYFANTLQDKAQEKSLPIFKQTCCWLDIYFSGNKPDFTPPLLIRATPFCKEVGEIMLKIPYGKTMTYGQIAAQIAKKRGLKKMSAQAVGGAVGHNLISLIIPCHRVIGANGNLTGYAAGLSIKRKLLQLESKKNK